MCCCGSPAWRRASGCLPRCRNCARSSRTCAGSDTEIAAVRKQLAAAPRQGDLATLLRASAAQTPFAGAVERIEALPDGKVRMQSGAVPFDRLAGLDREPAAATGRSRRRRAASARWSSRASSGSMRASQGPAHRPGPVRHELGAHRCVLRGRRRHLPGGAHRHRARALGCPRGGTRVRAEAASCARRWAACGPEADACMPCRGPAPPIELGELRWKTAWPAVFTGKLAADVSLGDSDAKHACRGFSRWHDDPRPRRRAAGQRSREPRARARGVGPTGTLRIRSESQRFDAGSILGLAEIEWRQVRLARAPGLDLGSHVARLRGGGNKVDIELAHPRAVLCD